jgi:putative transposase
MGRPPRSFLSGAVYHLTAHGTDDRAIFLDDDDRQSFVLRLLRVAEREAWCLYAVCLMDTHYHLVVEPSRGISDGMRVLNGAHSRAFNARHGRRGALFERRYADRQIHDEEHLASAVAYVEQNAASAGVVDDPADWPWSTYAGSPLRTLLARCLKVSDT